MKKCLGCLAGLFILSAFVSLKHESYADHRNKNGLNDGLSIPLGNQPNAPKEPTHTEDNAEIWWERVYVFFGWPNGITIWALSLTLIVIAEQTVETARAAKASELGALALVNVERPWVFVEHEINYADATEDSGDVDICTVKAVNRGRGYAEIVSYSEPRILLIRQGDKLPDDLSLPPENVSHSELL